MLKVDIDFGMAKNGNFSKRRNKDLPLNKIHIVGKKFMFYVEGASSVRNTYGERLLKTFVFTIGLKLQFFTFHKFAMFSDRHQLK